MPTIPSAMAVEQALKDQRVAIDRCIKRNQQIAEVIAHMHGESGLATKYMGVSTFRLMDAKMWCGQVLGELGHELPEEYRDEAK